MKQWIVLLGILLGVVGVVLAITIFSGPRTERSAPRGSGTDAVASKEIEVGSAASAPPAPTTSRRVESRAEIPSTDLVELVFRDPDESPVPSVEMWLLPGAGRLVPVNQAERLAQSDEKGSIRIRASSRESLQPRRVIARAPGFQSADVSEHVLRPGKHIVTLQPSESLVVRCVDTSGAAIGDANVAMSQDNVRRDNINFSDPAFVGAVPGSDSKTAIFLKSTDAAGLARFDGLSPGRFSLQAAKPGLVMVDGPGVIVVPDTTEVVITFGRLYATIVRISGDTILGGEMAPTESKKMSVGSSVVERGRAWTELNAKMPDACICVLAPVTSESPIIKYRLLLEKSGLQEFVVNASPLVDPPVVTIVDSSTFRRAEIQSGEALVRVLDGAGRPFPAVAPWRFTFNMPGVGTTRRSSDGIAVKISLGSKQQLPAGTYGVASFSKSVSDRLRTTTFQIQAGMTQTIDVIVDGEWMPCRVKALREDGQPIPRCALTIRMEGGGAEYVTIEDAYRDLWLPVGKGTLSLQDGTYTAEKVAFEVVSKGLDARQEFALRARRSGQ